MLTPKSIKIKKNEGSCDPSRVLSRNLQDANDLTFLKHQHNSSFQQNNNSHQKNQMILNFDNENAALALQQTKKQFFKYIQNQISDYSLQVNMQNQKNKCKDKIKYHCNSFSQILSAFITFIHQVEPKKKVHQNQYSFNSASPIFQNVSQQNIKRFYEAFQQQIKLTNTQYNQKIIKYFQELQIQYKHTKKHIKQIQGLEDQIFALKQKLETKSQKCLKKEIQLIRLKENLEKLKGQIRYLRQMKLTSKIQKQLELFRSGKQNPQSLKDFKGKDERKGAEKYKGLIDQKNYEYKNQDKKLIEYKSENKICYGKLNAIDKDLSRSKSRKKVSVFDYSPCLKLWQRQGTHKEQIKQMNNCQQCKIYERQLQGWLQKGS